MITVTGKTFDHRATLKQLGGRWNPSGKHWDFVSLDDAQIAMIRGLIGVQVIVEERKPKRNVPAFEYEPTQHGTRKPNIYGDETRFLNYFAEQNPVAFFGFSSLSKFRKFIENTPRSISDDERDGRNDGWRTGDFRARWCATPDMATALNLARYGWPEGVQMAQQIVDHFTSHHALQRRRKHSMAGGSVNVGRLLAGNPTHMRSRPKQPGKRTITFFAQTNMSGAIDPDHMIIRAALVAAIVDLLEGSGYSCEIIAINTTKKYDDLPMYQSAVTIKSAGEPLNLNDVVFALGHPSYLRRMLFGALAHDEDLRDCWDYGGITTNAFTNDHSTATNEFYVAGIPHVARKLISNGSLIEQALDIWSLIGNDKLPIEIA